MMKNLIIFGLASVFSFGAYADCANLFEQRNESATKLQSALNCYENIISTTGQDNAKADSLIRTSYLHMYNSEYYILGDSNKMAELNLAFDKAKDAAELFGRLFDLRSYEKLGESEKDNVARALYFYGTAISRYVEIKGKIEAIKRLSTIKRSMNTVIRMGRESIEHYGAHRTLAILNTKVPVIAGGNRELAQKYFEIATSRTETSKGYSSYPLNNLMYSEFLSENGTNEQACSQLSKIINITEDEILKLDNGYSFETLNDIKKARSKYSKLACK